MTTSPLELLERATTDQACAEIQCKIREGGYTVFYKLLEGLKNKIKTYRDDQAEEVLELIARGKRAFPEPGSLSPSWDKIWKQLEATVAFKNRALRAIPPEDRSGEWQVVLDNPHTIQEVVCYPGLSFWEAVYLYGYFRPGLEKNEYIRLQKVVSRIAEFGE